MTNARDVKYQADGTTMVGRLAVPDGPGPHPAVLIAPEANGLDDHQRERADHLADLGYAALAMDIHGNGTVITERDQMMARLQDLASDPERIRDIARAGLDVLLEQPSVARSKLAAIGYCFGGFMVMELARTGADLKAVVGFHPGLNSPRPQDSRNITGKVLICLGDADPVAPPEQRHAFEEEMRTAGVDWQLHLYGDVKHSFTHPNAEQAGMPGLKYDPDADRWSWRAMLGLFDDVFA
jgi:dienelactone hydrolase